MKQSFNLSRVPRQLGGSCVQHQANAGEGNFEAIATIDNVSQAVKLLGRTRLKSAVERKDGQGNRKLSLI